MQDTSFNEKRLHRNNLISWTSDLRFTHAVTLNPNRKELSIGSLRRMFSHFCLEVDRLKTGRHRAGRTYTGDRFEAIAFVENVETNIHLHAVSNFAPRYWGGRVLDDEMIWKLEQKWLNITKGSGQMVIEPRRDDIWGKYITKQIYREKFDYFIAADFHNNDRVVNYALDETLKALAN